jgi:hypothetical protein
VIYESPGHSNVILDVQRPRTSAQHLAHDPRLLEAPRRLALRRTRHSAKPRPKVRRGDDHEGRQPQRRQVRHLQLERGMLGSFGVDRMPRGPSQRRFPFEVETEAALLQRSDGGRVLPLRRTRYGFVRHVHSLTPYLQKRWCRPPKSALCTRTKTSAGTSRTSSTTTSCRTQKKRGSSRRTRGFVISFIMKRNSPTTDHDLCNRSVF